MSHSYACQQEIACLECGQKFSAELYMIVDIAERPDLLELIRKEMLHKVPCTHCGHTAPVEVPLLIYRPKQEPHLLFAVAAGMGTEWNEEQASELAERLKKSLGWGWRDAWIQKSSLIVRNRVMLPAELSDNPEAARKELEAKLAADTARLKAQEPERYYRKLLNHFVGRQDVDSKRQFAESYPDVLCPEAGDMLNAMMAEALTDRKPGLAAAYSQNLVLLDMWRKELGG